MCGQIRWHSGMKKFTNKGRIRVSDGGHLQMRRVTVDNSGEYVCTTGQQAVNMSVKVLDNEDTVVSLQERRQQLLHYDASFVETVERTLRENGSRSRSDRETEVTAVGSVAYLTDNGEELLKAGSRPKLKSRKKAAGGSQRTEISFQDLLLLFNVSQIPFTFVVEDWQPCSTTCGGDGLQVSDYYA